MRAWADAGHARALIVAVLIAAGAWADRANAAATLGFVENWPGTSTSTWGIGGSATSNPGTGGRDGAGDGFLLVSNALAGALGTFSSGPEYSGDWQLAGIGHVIVYLNDVGSANPLEIHFSLGRGVLLGRNFWQYNVGFIPPFHAWGAFDVDLTAAGNFTRIQGTGTFASALQQVDRVHLRHDPNPPAIGVQPDPIAADFGIDHLLLTNGLVSVDPQRVAVGRPVELAPPAPNPSRGPVVFSLVSPGSEPIHLQIVDAGGRLVRQAELPAGTAGARSWTWDGADDRGRQVAPGYYRARAWGPAGGTSRPLIRVR
jgi:hypothetical protein